MPGSESLKIKKQGTQTKKIKFICLSFFSFAAKTSGAARRQKPLFKNHPVHRARSAVTSDKAWVRLSQTLIDWADLIFVMERKHRDLVNSRFSYGIKSVITGINNGIC